jgi:hypothetical protein
MKKIALGQIAKDLAAHRAAMDRQLAENAAAILRLQRNDARAETVALHEDLGRLRTATRAQITELRAALDEILYERPRPKKKAPRR